MGDAAYGDGGTRQTDGSWWPKRRAAQPETLPK